MDSSVAKKPKSVVLKAKPREDLMDAKKLDLTMPSSVG